MQDCSISIANTLEIVQSCSKAIDASLGYFFRLQYVWFPVHLDTGKTPNSSGQLAELIVHIIPLE